MVHLRNAPKGQQGQCLICPSLRVRVTTVDISRRWLPMQITLFYMERQSPRDIGADTHHLMAPRVLRKRRSEIKAERKDEERLPGMALIRGGKKSRRSFSGSWHDDSNQPCIYIKCFFPRHVEHCLNGPLANSLPPVVVSSKRSCTPRVSRSVIATPSRSVRQHAAARRRILADARRSRH